MEAQLQEILYFEYFHDIRGLSTETLRSFVDEIWTELYFPSYQSSFETLLRLCQDPLPLKIRSIVVRQKANNKVIGNILSFLSQIHHLDKDESEINKYLVPLTYICVSKEHRYLHISNILIETLETFLIQEEGLVNMIYINLMANPFNFAYAMKRAKFAIPNIGSGITNPECEKMMFKYLATANTGSTGRRSDDSLYVFNSQIVFDNDTDYIWQNYDNMSKFVKYFVDITNLEQGCMVSVFHPIYLLENNTLGLEAGFNLSKPIIFNGEIRIIN